MVQFLFLAKKAGYETSNAGPFIRKPLNSTFLLSIEPEPVRPQRVIIEMKVTVHVHVILVIMLYKLGPTFRSVNES